MLRLADNPLRIDDACEQASCHFDAALYAEAAADGRLPAQLQGAVPKRKAEFIAGRHCARLALARHDAALQCSIGIGAMREPLWPPGYVGSITHALDFASAAVARSSRVRAVGIDAEAWLAEDKARDLRHLILRPEEEEQIRQLDGPAAARQLSLVFSAKESLYKCLFPAVQRFFGFHAARIELLPGPTPAQGRFSYELLEDLNAEFRKGYRGLGSYCCGPQLVHTAIVVKA